MKAFPRADMKSNSLIPDELGMDLRDYFASKAMQAYLNDDSLEELYVALNKDVKQELSKNAYKMADAMMKAREA